jgi:hypothetical protein
LKKFGTKLPGGATLPYGEIGYWAAAVAAHPNIVMNPMASRMMKSPVIG